ncbi:hypothetical protein Droror1_Dr00004735 [Drosera rotundifolia]
MGRLETSELMKMVVLIYCLWGNRNGKIHRKLPQPASLISRLACSFMIEKVTSINAIARNSEDDVLWRVGKNLSVQLSPIAGEVLAIKFGLELAKFVGMDRISLESDCKQIVKIIELEAGDRSLQGSIVDDCLNLMSNLQNVHCSWIPREANQCGRIYDKFDKLEGRGNHCEAGGWGEGHGHGMICHDPEEDRLGKRGVGGWRLVVKNYGLSSQEHRVEIFQCERRLERHNCYERVIFRAQSDEDIGKDVLRSHGVLEIGKQNKRIALPIWELRLKAAKGCSGGEQRWRDSAVDVSKTPWPMRRRSEGGVGVDSGFDGGGSVEHGGGGDGRLDEEEEIRWIALIPS